MRNKSDGRVCETKGVSLDPDMKRDAEERVKGLSPKIRSWSHYVQILIDMDLKHDLVNKGFSGKLPFESWS